IVGSYAQVESFAGSAGVRWALAGMLRSEPIWRACVRTLLHAGVRSAFATLKAGAESSRQFAGSLPTAAFPALGYVALVPAYLGHDKIRASVPLLERQVRLIFASATGRY